MPIYDQFGTPSTMRSYLAHQVQSKYHIDPFLKHVFDLNACQQFTVSQWQHNIVHTRQWGSMLEAVLLTYFMHVNIIILNNDFNNGTDSEAYLHTTYRYWNDKPTDQDLFLPIQYKVYIFHHKMNNPMSRQANQWNHFAYLKLVPLDRQIKMNENTIIAVVPEDTSTNNTTTGRSSYSKKRHVQTNYKRKMTLSEDIKDKAKKRRKQVESKKAYRVGKQTSIFKYLQKRYHDNTSNDINDTNINYNIPFQHTTYIPHLSKVYNSKAVYKFWKKCLQYGVPFLSPHQASTTEDYDNKMTTMKNAIQYQKRKKIPHIPNSFEFFDDLPYYEQLRKAITLEFEQKLLNTNHMQCSMCKFTTLNHTKWTSKTKLCTKCKIDPSWCKEENYVLPTWKNDQGILQYHVPEELKDLRIAEQLLIQRLSPYVPIVHICNGVFGIKGSCCAFRQDIKQICNSLPRKKVEMIKYVREFVKQSGEPCPIKILTVRRTKVMNALKWLKKYHIEYHNDEDLIIDESNLDWMEDKEEAEILNCMELHDNDIEDIEKKNNIINEKHEDDSDTQSRTQYEDDMENDNENMIYSISSLQRNKDFQDVSIDNENIEYTGALSNNEDAVNNPTCYMQIQELKNAYQSSNNKDNINEMLPWPNVTKQAESEFNGMRIFVNTFPWLFPGGVGDIKEPNRDSSTDKNPHQWANHLLHYFDGRFAKDKLWSFYVTNYIQRHHNQKSGRFFINNFVKYNCPESIQELKQQLRNGNTTFVDKLQYYSQKMKGSDAYWRSKKGELLSWIHHHLQKGNGPPTLFITLSCAEYYWPDIIKLLEERIQMDNVEGKCPDLKNNKSALIKAVNDYSIVIQEYFLIRVDHWLETVGKKQFGIKHYWNRLEFAKGRGQIHAHMLCIADNIHEMTEAYKKKDKPEERKLVLSNYVRQVFNMTAQHPATVLSDNNTLDLHLVGMPEGYAQTLEYKDEPSTKYCFEINDDDMDKCDLVNSCAMHECNAFCLRKARNRSVYCRSGCGSVDKDTGKTPGFKLRSNDEILIDDKGIQRLALKRNSTRMMQVSLDALQSWRANCDIQLILYDSDPKQPNLEEISKVCDYVVSYTCKGNMRQQTEKNLFKDIIQK